MLDSLRALLFLPLAVSFAACSASGASDSGASGGSAEPTPASDAGPASSTCSLGLELSEEDCQSIKALRLDTTLPNSPGNPMADNEEAAKLGHAVFFDQRFSSGAVRCGTCHDPATSFADARPVAKGLALGTRNSPTVLDAARLRWLTWDGRADSVWSQPLLAFENPKEMGFSRLEIAHRVASTYKPPYEALFGPMPPLDDGARFPARGKPGDAAWSSMTEADRAAVDRVAANVGKAIEAYVRKLATGPSAFDRFVDGKRDALSPEAKSGLGVFVASGCAGCHGGPRLSDGLFHNAGITEPDLEAARGRALGIELVTASPFNAAGAFFEGSKPMDFPPRKSTSDLGAFRTPSLRNVARTPPYGHDGRFRKLEDMIAFHLAARPAAVGELDPRLTPRALSALEMADLVSFLESLDGQLPERPWNDWPIR